MNRFAFSVLVLALVGFPVRANTDHKIDFGAFFDAFYAFDSNQPGDHNRLYTTNPTRHNEFNINLAFIEAKLSAERLRGRLALQTGTSVFRNYSSELRVPTATGGAQLADVLMHVQEAYAGYQISKQLWIDAGVYFSHIGSESFISKGNWTYTRSLVADFSPYYQAGIKLTWEPEPTWLFSLQVLNGWQNIIETNGDKALATQIAFRPSERLKIIHNTFVGREAELRFFQDLILQVALSPAWEALLTADLGLQKKAGGSLAQWWGFSLIARWKVAEDMKLAARFEYYEDPEGIIVPTGTANGFQVFGVSANLDAQLLPQLLWRNEIRWLQSRDAIYPAETGLRQGTLFGVTSLALSF